MTHNAQIDIIEQVLQHYPIGIPSDVRKLKRGFVNENWDVKTPQGRYFVKHYCPSLCHPAAIRARHTLIDYACRAGFPAAPIVSTNAGDTVVVLDGDCFEVQRYIEGTPYDHERSVHFAEAATTLGRYHATVADFAQSVLRRPRYHYTPSRIDRNLTHYVHKSQLTNDIEAAGIIGQLKRHVRTLQRRFARHEALPSLVIHGDYYGHNLIFHEDHVVGVVDFDKARWQPRVVELAEVLIYFASSRAKSLQYLVYDGYLRWRPFERFLHIYSQVTRPGEAEMRTLPDYVRCIWLQMSLRRLAEQEERPPDPIAALREVLALGDWAEENTERMTEIGITLIMRIP